MKHAQKRKLKRLNSSSKNDNSSSSWSVVYCSTGNIHKTHDCSKQKLILTPARLKLLKVSIQHFQF
jgi:hypothetical protein